jgi:arylsulfatase A-like enzyme
MFVTPARWLALDRLLVAVVATLSLLARPASGQPSQARPPSIVLVIMDDMGYGDVGSYGAPDVRTPNIDRLAREGVRMTDFYANGPVCSPTRAALMSGRYQQRTGLEWMLQTASAADQERGLPASPGSLPRLLQQRGYATGLVGKWHLGFKPEFSPNAHGFGEFFGFLSGAVDYYTHRRGDGRPDLYENSTPVAHEGYLTDEITARAVAFVDRHASGPFFLEVSYNAPHWPFQPPDRPSDALRDHGGLVQTQDAATPATRADYVAMLERADEGVGRILSAIDRHGLGGRTLVIFTNDNGGEWLSRNAPFFHRKGTLWEGGIRVPCLMRWPGRLPSGAVSGQPAMTMDLTATILSAAGASAPAAYRPDGVDLLPILSGTSAAIERTLYWRINLPTLQQRAVRSGDWKYLADSGQHLLFDVRKDPGEREDLAARRPDVVAMLRRLLLKWEAEVDGR